MYCRTAPQASQNGRHIVTDAYNQESLSGDDGVPIRLVDVPAERETVLCWMTTRMPAQERNVVWRRDSTQVCFNGAPDGNRQLFIADVRELVESA